MSFSNNIKPFSSSNFVKTNNDSGGGKQNFYGGDGGMNQKRQRRILEPWEELEEENSTKNLPIQEFDRTKIVHVNPDQIIKKKQQETSNDD